MLKGNKPLELRVQRRYQVVLYASDPAFLDAILADERGWRKLHVPAMDLIVFRHEVLMEFSRESLEFTWLPKPRQAGASESRLPATCPAKAESEGG